MSTFQPSVESANRFSLEARYHEQAFIAEPLTKQVKPVTLSDQEYAIATIVLAFSADPAARWIYPNAQQYLTYFPQSSAKQVRMRCSGERSTKLPRQGSLPF